VQGKELNETININPEELEAAIIKEISWSFLNYNHLRHNCHDFVKFCLKKREEFFSIHSAFDQKYVVDASHGGTQDFNKIQIC